MTKKNVVLIVLAVVAIAVSFAVGNSVGQRTMLAAASVQLNDVQAMLAFNHLLDDRELQSLLDRGCGTQAAAVVDFYRDKDTESLAGFFRGRLNESTRDYVSKRDPDLVKGLGSFQSKYGQQWAVPECKP